MKAFETLPQGYKEILSIDLQKNKKLMLLVNGIAIALAVPMFALGARLVPVSTLFDMSGGMGAYFARFGVLLGAIVTYMVLHELTHALIMKLCGTKKVKFGFTGMYAFAGSDDYYPKLCYICIALAPIVLLGIVLALINAFVPENWFWVVYIVQITNISGAGGDLYVTARFGALPGDILVRDYGVGMHVYSKE